MSDDVDSSQPTLRPGEAGRGAPLDGRALRVGVVLGVGFHVLSMAWDYLVAPWSFERLLQWRGAGIAVLLGAGIMSYAMPHRTKWLLAVAAGGSAVTVTAAALILPFGFGYGIGALMSISMAIALVALDKRTAAAASLVVLMATATTLIARDGDKDSMLAMGFFLVPSLLVAVAFAHLTSQRIERNGMLRMKLAALREDLVRFGRTDELTGVSDQRQMVSLARREIALARRKKLPLSALKIDVLHLDDINRVHGRAAGDETLRAVASMCQASLRETDLLARVAGDEFAAVLPEADAAGAAAISDRLRKGLEQASVLAGDKLLTVTVSVGAATLVDNDQGIEDLLARADAARRARSNPPSTSSSSPSPPANGANGHGNGDGSGDGSGNGNGS